MINNTPSNWFMETVQAAGDKMVAAFDSFMTWLINDGALARGIKATVDKTSDTFAALTPSMPSGPLMATSPQGPDTPVTERMLEIRRTQEQAHNVTPNNRIEEVWERATRTQTMAVSVEQLQALSNMISAPEHVGAEIFTMAPRAVVGMPANMAGAGMAMAS